MKNLRTALSNARKVFQESRKELMEGVDYEKYLVCTCGGNAIITLLALISIKKHGFKKHIQLCGKHFGQLVLAAIFMEAICITLSRSKQEEVTEETASESAEEKESKVQAQEVWHDIIKEAIKTAPVINLDTL